MKNALLDWRIWLAAAVVAAGGVLTVRRMMHTPDPEEIERRRLSHLNRVGRIVEGHIVELLERAAASESPRGLSRHKQPVSNGRRKLVCYSYSISGVSYETAQDVTGFENHAGLGRLVAGQQASVKYDPANPSNSILIADNWSGLQ